MLWYLLFEKCFIRVLLKCLLPYTNLIVYSKYLGSWSQTTVIANEFSSAMNVCIIGFNNHFMTCMLQIGESTIPRIFVAWIVFIKAIFSCLMMNFYLTACLRFLMKHGFIDKTVHKYTEYYNGTEGSPSTMVVSSVKILFIRVSSLAENVLCSWSTIFYEHCSKKCRLNIWVPIPIQWHK